MGSEEFTCLEGTCGHTGIGSIFRAFDNLKARGASGVLEPV